MKQKILITGATGFLGGYLVDECLRLGYEVIAFGRNATRGGELEERGLTFVQGDMENRADLEAVFAAGIDQVVHAGALSTIWGPWEAFYRANVQSTEHIVHLCQKYGVERLVFVSSPSIYAQARDQLQITEEEAPLDNRLNNYIRSKIAAEKIVKEGQIPFVIIRPRGLFGVGDTSLIPRLLDMNEKVGIPLLHNGAKIVDVTCVENVAYAMGLMLTKQEALGQTYNISNGQAMPFKDLMSLFFQESGRQARFLHLPAALLGGIAWILEGIYRLFALKGEPRVTRYTAYLLQYSQSLSIKKAQEELGYAPIMTIEEGIKAYVHHQKG